MKVVVDTNILVSATFWLGDSEKIIKLAESSKIELYLSEEILQEYVDVLNYSEIQDKIIDKSLEIKMTIEKIRAISSIVSPKIKIDACEDKKDNKIIECALESNADFIITYDNHLLKLSEFNKTRILNPIAFLSLLK